MMSILGDVVLVFIGIGIIAAVVFLISAFCLLIVEMYKEVFKK